MSRPVNLIVVLGPTASGKTRLAVELARHLAGEILSADSRQVYRGMDLGTGKDLAEYGEVPRHLIDIAEPGEEFSVFEFQRLAFACIEELWAAGRMPLLCGGTGLYLDAVLRGYRLAEVPENPALRRELAKLDVETLRRRLEALRPRQHNRTDLDDRLRLIRAIEIAAGEAEAKDALPPAPDIRPLIFGLRWERVKLRRRIEARLDERLERGMIEEVRRLHEGGLSFERLDFYGLEYRFIARHLKGELDFSALREGLRVAIGQYAKRQETWFRRMERLGAEILWLDAAGDPLEEALAVLAASNLRQQGL